MRHVFALILLLALSAQAATTRPATRPAPTGGVNFTAVALSDALEHLRDLTGVNLHVNWKALEEAGIDKDTPVTLRVRAMTLRRTLSLLLAAADPAGNLTFYADQNVIEITTRKMADRHLVTRVYPVEDLLMEIPDFEGPDMSLTGRGNGPRSGRTDSRTAKTKAERGQELVQLITETIEPQTWRDNGGPSSIRYFDGKLIVTAPPYVHARIGE